ncbi:MAG: type II toxin-antitoxin system VapC family toxin [Phycisphaerae bacterium]|nr:PIN domain-containing protein [Phycisphaerae bacterium]NUQ45708.1 type II toxin-antitoxin system VapC family toxin [Phycisphaerae bacterium]
MNPCFGDTSYFLAMLIPSDVNHAAAMRWARVNRRPIISTEYVVVEVGNFLSPPRTRRLLVRFMDTLRSSHRFSLIPASSDLLERGIRLYEDRSDKSWSLTDCISFVVMRERDISEALTGDRHFEQAGFRALLKQAP